MSMIECINHKNNKERRRELLSEMHNDIEALEDMRIRLRKNEASGDILYAVSKAKAIIEFERKKMAADMRGKKK